MNTRREFLGWLGAAIGAPNLDDGNRPVVTDLLVGEDLLDPLAEETGSDVGSLFPFIASQAVKSKLPLSFLDEQFQDVAAWRAKARGKLLKLLHYAPPACEPRPELVESVDRVDHVREKIVFHTTPDVRTPAYVLIPKQGRRPLPAIVALHDHGGFYLWGKEKLVPVEPEHRVLADFKRRYYAGNSIAEVLVAQGYLVIVIDMFYWGERRMTLDDDASDWRERLARATGASGPRASRQNASRPSTSDPRRANSSWAGPSSLRGSHGPASSSGTICGPSITLSHAPTSIASGSVVWVCPSVD